MDVATEIGEKDNNAIEEAGMEIVLYDSGSTFFRVKINTSNLTTKEVVQKATAKLIKVCPNLKFNLDSASYGSRP